MLMQIKTQRRGRRTVPMEQRACAFCKRIFERPVNMPYKVYCRNVCTMLAFYERELVAAGKTVT